MQASGAVIACDTRSRILSIVGASGIKRRAGRQELTVAYSFIVSNLRSPDVSDSRVLMDC